MINIIKELASLNPLYSEELKHYLNYFTPNEPSPLTDFAAAITSADPVELQGILETVPIPIRTLIVDGYVWLGPERKGEATCGRQGRQRDKGQDAGPDRVCTCR